MTFSIVTINKITLGIMPLSKMIIRLTMHIIIVAHSTITLSIKTLRFMDTENNNIHCNVTQYNCIQHLGTKNDII